MKFAQEINVKAFEKYITGDCMNLLIFVLATLNEFHTLGIHIQ